MTSNLQLIPKTQIGTYKIEKKKLFISIKIHMILHFFFFTFKHLPAQIEQRQTDYITMSDCDVHKTDRTHRVRR